MNLAIRSTGKNDYLLIKVAAVISNDLELISYAEALYKESQKWHYQKILLELTHTRLPKTVLAYFELVKHYKSNFPAEMAFLKIACVITAEYKVFGDFWETAAVNRGFSHYIFTSIQEAEEFLLKK